MIDTFEMVIRVSMTYDELIIKQENDSWLIVNSYNRLNHGLHLQKAILDGELDMMASKNKEADVLKKKINDIKSAVRPFQIMFSLLVNLTMNF